MLLNKKRIAFLVGPGFEDLEFWAVYMRLVEEGAQVTIVGLKAGEVDASKSGGLTATADVAAKDVPPDQPHTVDDDTGSNLCLQPIHRSAHSAQIA